MNKFWRCNPSGAWSRKRGREGRAAEQETARGISGSPITKLAAEIRPAKVAPLPVSYGNKVGVDVSTSSLYETLKMVRREVRDSRRKGLSSRQSRVVFSTPRKLRGT